MSQQSWRAQSPEQLRQFVNFMATQPIPENGWRIDYKPWRAARSLSQNAFQHVIYAEVSRYLISRGRTDCDEQWVKDMLKNKYLGWVDREFVDVVTGEVTKHECLRETSKLDVGEAVHYTDQILMWCADIGCEIKIPTMCDYRLYKESQDA